MKDLTERVGLQLAFETWAIPEGLDLKTTDGGFTYSNTRTFDVWRGYFAAHGVHGQRAAGQQLYAEIKKSSRYACQAEFCRNSPYGYPFKVRIVGDLLGYVVKGGIGGQYRITDVNIYVIEDGKKIRLH